MKVVLVVSKLKYTWVNYGGDTPRDRCLIWRFPNSWGMKIATPLQIKGEVEIFISPQVKIRLRER